MGESNEMLLQAEVRNAVKQVRNAKTDEEAVEFIGRLLRKYYSEGYQEGYDDGFGDGYDDGWENGNMGLN